MKSHRILVFDISGEYGHYRKFNTTSSPLTYSIPTRSALSGVLGAILGIEREIAPGIFPEGVVPVNELFSPTSCNLAIQLLNPVKKVNIGFNLLDTGKSASSFFNIKNRTQIEFELLKNPKFRIFFSHSDESIFSEVSKRIKTVSHHFTPYLGLSQFTAVIDWIDETTATPASSPDDYFEIHSVINLSKLSKQQPIKFEELFYSTDTLPMSMRSDRVITEYAEILIEKTGRPILAKTPSFWKTNFGNIIFL